MSRHSARRLALEALYSCDIAEHPPGRAVADRIASLDERRIHLRNGDRHFFRRLVTGTLRHQTTIDGLIDRYARDWRLERMGRVDRNILRLALYELLYAGDAPPRVVINEAVELAKEYGGEESSRFINGILGRLAEDRSLVAPTPPGGGADPWEADE